MSRGSSRHVHYDDKKHKSSYHRRQRRQRRVSRRAKLYGAAFLLALTGFFCLVPGTSLTVVAFTNGTNPEEGILRLLGPVFGGVGVILVGISIGLVCYAVLFKHRLRKNKECGKNGGLSRDGEKLSAEVRLLDAESPDSGSVKVKHKLVPNYGDQNRGNHHRSAVVQRKEDAVPPSTVIVDIVHPPSSMTVSASPGTSKTLDESLESGKTSATGNEGENSATRVVL